MQDNAAMSLESFIDRLLEEKGLQNMEPAVLAEMKADLLERVADRLNAEMIAAMPQEKISELNELMDGGNPEEVRAFLTSNVPNFDNVLAQTLLNFRTTYLG
jgi:hypothetical protein